jgi:hypothetical protein
VNETKGRVSRTRTVAETTQRAFHLAKVNFATARAASRASFASIIRTIASRTNVKMAPNVLT